MRRRTPRLAGAALAIAFVPTLAHAGPYEVCTTVEGAPAATSASLVLGMQREMRSGDRVALKQFLDTGQTLLLHGGKPAEVLKRDAGQGVVQFRRAEGHLPLWTVADGLRCPGAPHP